MAAFAFYLAPNYLKLDPNGQLILATVVFAIPITFLALRYLSAVLHVLGQRIRHYPNLYRMLQTRVEASESLADRLAEAIADRPRYEILKVLWFSSKKEVGLLIRKKGGKPPDVGATFLLFDEEDRQLMAVLEMIENRSAGYYARAVSDIHPLWYGDVIKNDTQEQQIPPGVVAFLIRKTGES